MDEIPKIMIPYCKAETFYHTEMSSIKFVVLLYSLKSYNQNHSVMDHFNPIRAGGAESARPFFRWLFLHEKRGLEVQNFVTFPNSL